MHNDNREVGTKITRLLELSETITLLRYPGQIKNKWCTGFKKHGRDFYVFASGEAVQLLLNLLLQFFFRNFPGLLLLLLLFLFSYKKLVCQCVMYQFYQTHFNENVLVNHKVSNHNIFVSVINLLITCSSLFSIIHQYQCLPI